MGWVRKRFPMASCLCARSSFLRHWWSKMTIEYQEYTKSYLLTCDRCGRHDSVRTARTEHQMRHIAQTLFKWQMDTPHGDLCPSCSAKRRGEVFDLYGGAASRNEE